MSNEIGVLVGSGVIKDKDGNVKQRFELTSDPLSKEKAKEILNNKSKIGVTDHGDHSSN